jgi:hypothetical protein
MESTLESPDLIFLTVSRAAPSVEKAILSIIGFS